MAISGAEGSADDFFAMTDQTERAENAPAQILPQGVKKS